MSGRVRRYFFSFLPMAMALGLPIAIMLVVGFTFALRSPAALPLGVAAGTLYGAGIAWMLAWMASRRRVLSRPQEAKGLCYWRYLDLEAPCAPVFTACADALRAICKGAPILEDPARGVLISETRPNLLTWGCEVSFWIEARSQTRTRVQVLSRPVVPINVSEFGANLRIVNRAAEMLRTRFTVIAEG